MSVIMASPEALCVATYRGSGQKSAEGIVVPPWRDEGPNLRSEWRSNMSSEAAKNPTGGAGSRHVMERDSSILSQWLKVLERETQSVQAGQGKQRAGIDNISVEEFLNMPASTGRSIPPLEDRYTLSGKRNSER
jgi:hypothetical protein